MTLAPVEETVDGQRKIDIEINYFSNVVHFQ